MQLPEDVQCDSTMRRGNRLVTLTEHGLPGIHDNVFREHLMGDFVDS